MLKRPVLAAFCVGSHGITAQPAAHNNCVSGKAYLVPLPLSVQSDYDHGRIHQVSVAVEGEVVVFPCYVQHVPEDKQRQMSLFALMQLKKNHFGVTQKMDPRATVHLGLHVVF